MEKASKKVESGKEGSYERGKNEKHASKRKRKKRFCE